MPPGPAAVPPQIPASAALYVLFLLASIAGAWVWGIVRLAQGQSILPRFTPRIVPWRGATVFLVVALCLAVQAFGPAVYLVIRESGQVQGVRLGALKFSASEMMVVSAIENTGLLLVLPLLMMALSRARPRDFLGTDAGNLRAVRLLQGIIAWPLIAPVVYGLMSLAVWVWGRESHPLEQAIATEGLGQHAWVFFLASVALAPMAEELVFRGAILGWLTRLILRRAVERKALAEPALVESPDPPREAGLAQDDSTAVGTELASSSVVLDAGSVIDVTVTPVPWPPPRPTLDFAPPLTTLDGVESEQVVPDLPWSAVVGRFWAANVLVSVLFAALHATVWPTPVPIFLLSLMLGFLYQRTGSLLAPVALHMTFNAASTVLMFLTVGATPPAPDAQGRPAPARPATPSSPTPAPKSPLPIPAPGPIPVDGPTPVPIPVPTPVP